MDISQPNQPNKDLSTQNQPQMPVTPPSPPPPPPAVTAPDSKPVTSPPSIPPSSPPPPPQSNIPLQQPSEHNVGIGTPNIGVEEKQTPASPPIPPSNTPPSQEKDDTVIEVESYGPPVAAPSAQLTHQEPATNNIPQPVQVKNYQNQNPSNTPQPPVKAGGSGVSLAILVVLALILGSAGGFFGFRYWDQAKTSADTESSSPETATSPSLDINTWSTYTSTTEKFTVKYPNGWFANTTSGSADTIIFASNKESLEGTLSGFKVEINFQNTNGQTLKKWVEANTVTTGEKKSAKEITVSGQTAYQQELSKNGTKVATYIERSSKVMIVTYSAPDDIFGDGGQWYNNLINSITLL